MILFYDFFPLHLNCLLSNRCFAHGAYIILQKPTSDALTVEKVSLITWQRSYFIGVYVIEKANRASIFIGLIPALEILVS